MDNLSIKIDLMKISGAFMQDIQGRTATKRCVCIPIEDAGLFVGQKGTYLDILAVARNSAYGDTHFLKANLPKEKYQALTDEQKRALPIIGSLKPIVGGQQSAPPAQPPAPTSYDDMPF